MNPRRLHASRRQLSVNLRLLEVAWLTSAVGGLIRLPGHDGPIFYLREASYAVRLERERPAQAEE